MQHQIRKRRELLNSQLSQSYVRIGILKRGTMERDLNSEGGLGLI